MKRREKEWKIKRETTEGEHERRNERTKNKRSEKMKKERKKNGK